MMTTDVTGKMLSVRRNRQAAKSPEASDSQSMTPTMASGRINRYDTTSEAEVR